MFSGGIDKQHRTVMGVKYKFRFRFSCACQVLVHLVNMLYHVLLVHDLPMYLLTYSCTIGAFITLCCYGLFIAYFKCFFFTC